MERLIAVAALLLAMLIWGIGPLFIRAASVTMGPSNALVIRYSLVSILYLGILVATGGYRIAREDWPRLLLVSLVGMVGYNLGSAFGFLWVPAGIGGIIIGTQPLVICVLAAIFVSERMTSFTIAGIIIAFLGTFILFWKDLSAPEQNIELLLGAVLVFLCGVAWGFYVVLSRPLIRRYGSVSITALSIVIATLAMLALARPTTYDTLLAMDGRQWTTMFYLVVLSTFVAAITWNFGSMRLSAGAAGAFLYLVPPISVAAGAIWFGEPVTGEMLIGGILILMGVAVSQVGHRLLRFA